MMKELHNVLSQTFCTLLSIETAALRRLPVAIPSNIVRSVGRARLSLNTYQNKIPTNAWRERGRKASRRRVAHNTEGTRTRNRTIEERTQIQQVDMNARARIEIEAKLLLSFLTTLKPELEWAHTAPKSRPNKTLSLERKPSRANKKED